MNQTERRMLDLVRKGREHFHVNALKAEFEAEGTRTEEFLRLLEIARRAGVKIGLKIGGCEGIRDLHEARQFGVDYVIAPMIETPYALSKYIDAKNKVFPADERRDIGFLYNLETIAAFEHLDAITDLAGAKNGLDGVVFGRVDFAGSLGLTREVIDSDRITDYVCKVAERSARAGLQVVMGGGVSTSSVDALRRVRKATLTRFETRKIIFDAALLDQSHVNQALLLAMEFELLWLTNKRDYYRAMSVEDEQRIVMLEKRVSAARANPALERV